MIDIKTINDLAAKLADAIPDGVKHAGGEAKQQFEKILKAGLSKMDLVTREEFDVQTKVLARTREKLTTLETQLAELEKAQSRL
jgi:BMFP domain-containing protein YqiC